MCQTENGVRLCPNSLKVRALPSGQPPPNVWLLFTLGGDGFWTEFLFRKIIIIVNNNLYSHSIKTFSRGLPFRSAYQGFSINLASFVPPLSNGLGLSS